MLLAVGALSADASIANNVICSSSYFHEPGSAFNGYSPAIGRVKAHLLHLLSSTGSTMVITRSILGEEQGESREQEVRALRTKRRPGFR